MKIFFTVFFSLFIFTLFGQGIIGEPKKEIGLRKLSFSINTQLSDVHSIIKAEETLSIPKAEFSYGYGVELSYRLFQNKLSVFSGIGYRTIQQSFGSADIDIFYANDKVTVDDNGDLIGNFPVSFYSNYGYFSIDYSIRFQTSYYWKEPLFVNGDLVRLVVLSQIAIKAINLPIGLQYNFGNKRTQFLMRIGGRFNFIQQGQIVKYQTGISKITSEEGDPWKLSLENYMLTKKVAGLNQTMAELFIAIGFESKLSNRFSLFMNGGYSKALAPIFEDAQTENTNYMYNLSTGLKYFL